MQSSTNPTRKKKGQNQQDIPFHFFFPLHYLTFNWLNHRPLRCMWYIQSAFSYNAWECFETKSRMDVVYEKQFHQAWPRNSDFFSLPLQEESASTELWRWLCVLNLGAHNKNCNINIFKRDLFKVPLQAQNLLIPFHNLIKSNRQKKCLGRVWWMCP